MGEVGFELLKDIPGFQAILKTLVKSQLQHLINQLSEHGDSETILLSVNCCDGTIQQLGSRKGEEFLGFRHDVKTQFLQYCLQSYQPDVPANAFTTDEEDHIQSQSHNQSVSHDHSMSHDHSVHHGVSLSLDHSVEDNSESLNSKYRLLKTNRSHLGSFAKLTNYTYKKHKRKSLPNRREERNGFIVKNSCDSDVEPQLENINIDVKQEPLSPKHTDMDITSNGTGKNTAMNIPNLSQNTYLTMDNKEFNETYMSAAQSLFKPKQVFKCQKCGKMFKNAQNLKVHDRKHSGIRPYSCEFCDQRFYQQSHLRCHVRTHTGEKPYECTHCGQRFTQSSSMHSHIRIQHPVVKKENIE